MCHISNENTANTIYGIYICKHDNSSTGLTTGPSDCDQRIVVGRMNRAIEMYSRGALFQAAYMSVSN